MSKFPLISLYRDGRFAVQLFFVELTFYQRFRNPCNSRKGIYGSMFIRGYYTYQSQWNAEVGTKLGAVPDTRTTALVKDAIAVKNGKQTVGHIPMFLSKLTFFFLRYDGKDSMKVNGPKRYSVDLIQGGLELPAEFTFQTSNEKLFSQMQEETLLEMEKFEEKRKKMEDEMKKKKKKPKIDKNKKKQTKKKTKMDK